MEPQQDEPAEQLRREIKALEGRDFQLWSIGLLLLMVVAAGFIALILPNVMWNLPVLRLDGRYLPQLFFGFIALIVLFNVYALEQRRGFRRTREELILQLIRSEVAESLSLIDALTGVFNRRYLDQILPKEVSRADRLGSSLAILMVDVDSFKAVNTRFGHVVGDQVLTEVAQVLKASVRASDTVIRYGGDEFLVLMGDTDEQQAKPAVDRLLARVDRWSQAGAIPGYKMSLSCGLAVYSQGANLAEVIEAADQRMFQQKLRKLPVA